MSHSAARPDARPSTMPTSEGAGAGAGETALTDVRLAAEIELLGEVIAVVGDHDGPLTADEVDQVLGANDSPED
jgi:hypothetical protein